MKKKVKYVAAGIAVCLIILVVAFVFYFKAAYGNCTLVVYFSRVGNTEFSDDVDAVSSASLRRERSGKLVGNCEALPQSNVKNGIAISGGSVDFLKYWIIGILAGMILLVLSAGMTKKHKENPVKSKVWFACAVAALVLIIICVIKLLI